MTWPAMPQDGLAPDAAPAPRMRMWLLGLAAVCVAGGLALAAGLSLHRAAHEETAIETSALAAARATSQAADREIATAVARLQALATSPALRAGEARAFHDQLVATPKPDGTWFVLWSTEQQVLNTLRPFGTQPLPRLTDFGPGTQATIRRIMATRQIEVSPVVWGVAAQAHVIAVTMPVVLDGQVTHLFDHVLSDRRIGQVIDDQQLDLRWRGALVDRYGATVALAHAAARPPGLGVPEAWMSQLRGPAARGGFLGERDGQPVLVAFARSALSDWTAVVEVPRSIVTEPVRTTITWLLEGGLALVVIGGVLAWLVAGRADRPIEALRSSAAQARSHQREAEGRYQTHWQHSPEALFALRVTPEDRFVFDGLNPTHERMSGLRSASVLGREPKDCFPEDAAKRMTERCRKCIASGSAMRYEESLALPAGRRDWEISLVPLRDSGSGSILRILGSARDVTERRQSEAALRESENRLRLAQEAGGVATWDWDLATGRVQWSPPPQAIIEGDLGDWDPNHQDNWFGILHPDDRDLVNAAISDAIAARRPFDCEFRIVLASGVRWLLSRGSLAPQAGSPRRVLGVLKDVTERKRAAQERDEALALFRGMAETSPDIVYLLDLPTVRILYANGRIEEVLGYAPAEIDTATADGAGAVFAPAFAGGAAGRRDTLASLADGEVAECEHRVRHRDGSWRWLSIREAAFTRGPDGDVTRILGCAHDITAARSAEDALRGLGSKLLTLQDDERRKIARELHDSTAQILVGASFAVARAKAVSPGLPQEGDDAIEDALSLIEESQREIRTLAYLLHPPLLEEMGLPAALRWLAKGFERRSGLSLIVEVAPELEGRRLASDVESALFRISQEAIGNAYRHSGGTEVRIALRCATDGASMDQRQVVVLTVRDNGRGIGVTHLPSAGGTDSPLFGIGLVGMRERMVQLGGKLTVRPADQGGTLVKAVVAVTDAAASDLAVAGTLPSAPGKHADNSPGLA